jgi:hypothetical protein
MSPWARHEPAIKMLDRIERRIVNVFEAITGRDEIEVALAKKTECDVMLDLDQRAGTLISYTLSIEAAHDSTSVQIKAR